ncbi:MAG: asparagine synthase (glutamine-hydrolyzing) [Deltaproteobacteria bacterium]|jgi:asparagine synthase (glutamine-hydrolysing)|nr:asparagine synthase (glutamine-hydrolyzing) [Deltaproteobacteria bacterium]
MCGIAGATRNLLGENPDQTLHRMNQVMLHRGPDMGEVTCDADMGLCHRRLSIIDLSEDGRQPMVSRDGRFTIVFNGEIYNFLELRKELSAQGHQFQTKTDTEVLLHAFMEYGPSSLDKVRGMFAYAIWDKKEKRLFAARDRIGKKPLYYYFYGGKFAFASEIKSLLEIEEVQQEIDPTAIIDYLKYLFIPHPKSIYKNIFKLEPGHFLTFSAGQIQTRQYWDVDFSKQSRKNEEELGEELLATIKDAVECRLISDVPLGAFLSGGIDSSAVVALMNSLCREPVTTCTIGFEDKAYNEAEYAKDFSGFLHTAHHEHYVKNEPAKIVKKLVWHFDEPFADSSMVPTYYVSNVARRHVTVALSGDGGDESFAGYTKYSIDRYENMVRQWIPHLILNTINTLTRFFPAITPVIKLNSLCRSAMMTPAEGFYVTNTFIADQQLNSLLSQNLKKQVNGYNPADHLIRYYNAANGPDHISKILYTDLKHYLPGDILVKVDRMSMANSLEVRAPLLDHKVIELAARIPSSLKLHRGQKKYILKNTFSRILPEDILTRKKHGFDVPLNSWFRRELKEMAKNSLFHNQRLQEFFQPQALKLIWNQHQSGKMSHGTLLWTLFIFSLWIEEIQ